VKKQCQECEYLDTSRKQQYGKAYWYGCGLRAEGYISTWINTDALLPQVSCNPPVSDDEEPESEEVKQMTIFDIL
jgi:predicted esterase YcpF (UPF0227 family)